GVLPGPPSVLQAAQGDPVRAGRALYHHRQTQAPGAKGPLGRTIGCLSGHPIQRHQLIYRTSPFNLFPHSPVSFVSMNLDKHRESLVKYCYDISKVACGVAVLNPAVGKTAVSEMSRSAWLPRSHSC